MAGEYCNIYVKISTCYIVFVAVFTALLSRIKEKGKQLPQFPEDDPHIVTSATQQGIDFVSDTPFEPVSA